MGFDEYFGFDLEQRKTLKRLLDQIAAGDTGQAATIAAHTTAISNLNAWGTALATKLNAQFTAANAETTLPFSPALAVDYDTDPQA